MGSLGVLLGSASVVGGLSVPEFLARLRSPLILSSLGLLALIYIPASLRIYYILLLKAKGVFTVAQRQEYQRGKEKWDRHLLKAALAASILIILLGLLLRLSTS